MASPGVGTTPHVSGELFKMMTGIDFTHVLYRGPLLPDLLAGHLSEPLQHRVDNCWQ